MFHPLYQNPSRIDYILVSPLLIPFVQAFRVTHATGIPTHSPITLTLRVPDTGIPRYHLTTPRPFLLPDEPKLYKETKEKIQQQEGHDADSQPHVEPTGYTIQTIMKRAIAAACTTLQIPVEQKRFHHGAGRVRIALKSHDPRNQAMQDTKASPDISLRTTHSKAYGAAVRLAALIFQQKLDSFSPFTGESQRCLTTLQRYTRNVAETYRKPDLTAL